MEKGEEFVFSVKKPKHRHFTMQSGEVLPFRWMINCVLSEMDFPCLDALVATDSYPLSFLSPR